MMIFRFHGFHFKHSTKMSNYLFGYEVVFSYEISYKELYVVFFQFLLNFFKLVSEWFF